MVFLEGAAFSLPTFHVDVEIKIISKFSLPYFRSQINTVSQPEEHEELLLGAELCQVLILGGREYLWSLQPGIEEGMEGVVKG